MRTPSLAALLFVAAPLAAQQPDFSSFERRLTDVEARVAALEAKAGGHTAHHDTYAAARTRAIAEGKPLVVWSGSAVCPACVHDTEGEWVNYVGTLPECSPNALTVAVPENGDLWNVATVTEWVVSDPVRGHVPSIRRALARWRERREVTRGGGATVSASASAPMMSYAPQFAAMPMMGYGQPMMMGGGGMMAGGGCASCGSSGGRGFFRR